MAELADDISTTDDSTLICSITLESITVAGITAVGSIYGYNAIKTWLETHRNDPLTNLGLPTIYVHKCQGTPAELRQLAKTIRQNNALLQYTASDIALAPDYYQQLFALHPNVQAATSWSTYCEMKQLQLCGSSNAFCKLCSDWANPDDVDTIPRPPDTGMRMQFVHIKDKTYSNSELKSELFDFAVLKNVVFIGCGMQRCRFIGTTFNNVLFYNCNMIGEQVVFYKAQIRGPLEFNNCVFEPPHNWSKTSDPAKVREILKQRLLEGEPTVS